ncbi:MAG: GNAT family N-acetyltransferase [Actinobacteria bacterium]|nr:GNAT family N-acetyltransferase [Actinomycetota bacterium]
MEIVPYARRHLEPILAVATTSDFSATLASDPERAHRALSAPGAVALVALAEGEVLGFAHAITDGVFQAYLVLLLVAQEARGHGVGRALTEQVMARSGAIRTDLISMPEAEGFYQGFEHAGPWSGYRLYPPGADGASGAAGDEG